MSSRKDHDDGPVNACAYCYCDYCAKVLLAMEEIELVVLKLAVALKLVVALKVVAGLVVMVEVVVVTAP